MDVPSLLFVCVCVCVCVCVLGMKEVISEILGFLRGSQAYAEIQKLHNQPLNSFSHFYLFVILLHT